MESFASYLSRFNVSKGQTGVFWLGQAGFAFKSANGCVIAVDPYYSDCCNRYFGFRRLIPYLMDPKDFEFCGIICTHAHYDHFDPDGIPMALSNGKTKLIAAEDCRAECERLHIVDNVTYMKVGDINTVGDFEIKAVNCDHGKDTPFAVGLIITDKASGKKFYIMGDTCYRGDWYENKELHGMDALILPINGAYGNLNEKEAAKVCSVLKPKLAIPCHFGNFAEHHGDPGLFQDTMKAEVPDVNYRLFRVGEGIKL